jgi:hypothetical protein
LIAGTLFFKSLFVEGISLVADEVLSAEDVDEVVEMPSVVQIVVVMSSIADFEEWLDMSIIEISSSSISVSESL